MYLFLLRVWVDQDGRRAARQEVSSHHRSSPIPPLQIYRKRNCFTRISLLKEQCREMVYFTFHPIKHGKLGGLSQNKLSFGQKNFDTMNWAL
jgi:hypothetical protein